MKSYKPKKRPEISYETDDSLPKQIINEATEQLKLSGKDFWAQIIGLNGSSDKEADKEIPQQHPNEALLNEKNGNSRDGVVFQLSSLTKSEQAPVVKQNKEKTQKIAINAETLIEPGISYLNQYREGITNADKNLSRREASEETKQIQQILVELKKLITSSKALQVEFGIVAVEVTPANPGKYYVNFFEWLLVMIHQARQKVEDSKAWLGTVHGKNSKKDYWGKSKKHGTTFTQANERYVATSTG
jgi:hypothetical protein